jgi:hypothetical protein
VNGDEVSRFVELGYQVVEDASFIYKSFYCWNSPDGRVGGHMPLQGMKYQPSILQPVASLNEMSWLIP